MKAIPALVLTITAIFIVILLGAYFSPTFSEQKTYLELFFLLGSLLFIFSVLVVFAAIGFRSFALFLTLFLTIVMVVFGIEGALLVSSVTYFFWGSIFAMEVLLFYNGVKSAQEWFLARYTYRTFKMEYYAFYPMLYMLYVFLEFVPSLLYREKFLKFSPSKVLKVMADFLKPE